MSFAAPIIRIDGEVVAAEGVVAVATVGDDLAYCDGLGWRLSLPDPPWKKTFP